MTISHGSAISADRSAGAHGGRPVLLHRAAGAVVVVVGYALVVRSPSGQEWTLPRGHLKLGEAPALAATRVVRDRTGLDVEILAALNPTSRGTTDFEPELRLDWFLAQPVGGVLDLGQSIGDIRFLEPADAARVLTFGADRDALASAVAMRSHNVSPTDAATLCPRPEPKTRS